MVPRLTWTFKVNPPSVFQIVQQLADVAGGQALYRSKLAGKHLARGGLWISGDTHQNVRGEFYRIVQMARICGIEEVVHGTLIAVVQDIQRQVMSDLVTKSGAHRCRMMRRVEIDQTAL